MQGRALGSGREEPDRMVRLLEVLSGDRVKGTKADGHKNGPETFWCMRPGILVKRKRANLVERGLILTIIWGNGLGQGGGGQ